MHDCRLDRSRTKASFVRVLQECHLPIHISRIFNYLWLIGWFVCMNMNKICLINFFLISAQQIIMNLMRNSCYASLASLSILFSIFLRSEKVGLECIVEKHVHVGFINVGQLSVKQRLTAIITHKSIHSVHRKSSEWMRIYKLAS
jgi:hypothetical protein